MQNLALLSAAYQFHAFLPLTDSTIHTVNYGNVGICHLNIEYADAAVTDSQFDVDRLENF